MSDINLVITEDTVEFIHVAEQGLAGPPGPAAEGLTVDQTAAINGANAPSAGNVFATVNQLPTGTNTGDETATSIKNKLGISILSGSNTGDQDLSGKADKQSGVILGQKDARTDLSPADGATATLDCTLGNAFKITAPDTGAGMDFIIALSNVPAGAVTFAIEVCIIVGTNIPTISLTNKGANVTLPTLTASRKNVWVISTWDNGTTLQVNDAGKF